MFEHGLESLHIKKPGFSKKQLKKYIELIPTKHHNKIIIHSHYSLALRYNLKGIHLSNSFRNAHFLYKKYISLYKIIKPKLRNTICEKALSLFEYNLVKTIKIP